MLEEVKEKTSFSERKQNLHYIDFVPHREQQLVL